MATPKIALGYISEDTTRPESTGLYRLIIDPESGMPKLIASEEVNDISISPAFAAGSITGTNVTVSGGTNAALGAVSISIPQSVATSASPTFSGLTINSGGSVSFVGVTVLGVTKAMIGLSLVDNTADADKEVSGPQLTALNGKLSKAKVSTHAAMLALTVTDLTLIKVAVDEVNDGLEGTVFLKDTDDSIIWLIGVKL